MIPTPEEWPLNLELPTHLWAARLRTCTSMNSAANHLGALLLKWMYDKVRWLKKIGDQCNDIFDAQVKTMRYHEVCDDIPHFSLNIIFSWYSYWYSYDLCKEAPGLAIRSPQMVLSNPTQAPSNFTGRQGRCTRCLGTFWDWPRVSWLCQSTLAANRRLSCEKTHFSAFPRVNWGNWGNSPRIIWSFVLPSTLHSPRAVWNQSLSHGCWVTEDIATAGHHGIVLL